MASDTATRPKRRRTTMVPVTAMEEVPVLSANKERAELTASLKDAEARVKAGKGVDYDPKTFKDRLVHLRADIDKGIRSLDAGDGCELNIDEFIRNRKSCRMGS